MKCVKSDAAQAEEPDTHDGEAPGEELFPFVRLAIVRAHARTGAAVPREAVVSELLAMPETRGPLLADAARHVGSGALDWAALNLLLFFDHCLMTGRLPEYEDEIVRAAGPRGSWTYETLLRQPGMIRSRRCRQRSVGSSR